MKNDLFVQVVLSHQTRVRFPVALPNSQPLLNKRLTGGSSLAEYGHNANTGYDWGADASDQSLKVENKIYPGNSRENSIITDQVKKGQVNAQAFAKKPQAVRNRDFADPGEYPVLGDE
jgi:hypothetical protein